MGFPEPSPPANRTVSPLYLAVVTTTQLVPRSLARLCRIGYVAAMSDLGPGRRVEHRLAHDDEFVHNVAWGLGAIGVLAGVVGVIIGLVMAFHSTRIVCPNGHFTPVGGDPNCYSHPDAGLGSAIALISFVLTILLLLVAALLLLQGATRRSRV